MSFSTPKVDEPPPPPKKQEGLDSAALYKRRQAAGSGIVSNFLGGASGEPGNVGKLGLSGFG